MATRMMIIVTLLVALMAGGCGSSSDNPDASTIAVTETPSATVPSTTVPDVCGSSCTASTDTNVSESNTSTPIVITLDGVVKSGGTNSVRLLSNRSVSLYKSVGATTQLLATSISDAYGAFSFTLASNEVEGVLFVSAVISDGVELLSVLGTSLPSSVIVNELTTVAGAYAFAQLFNTSTDRIQGNGTLLPLQIAAGMNANLVNVTTGTPSNVLLASPNADQTNTLRSMGNLANLLAAVVRDPITHKNALFAITPLRDGTLPTSTVESMVFLARNPAADVNAVYLMSAQASIYSPTLQPNLAHSDPIPDAWTLAIKVNDTGSPLRSFGGAANTVFDERGYAWINNNTNQGSKNSSDFIVVLKPDGTPSDGTDGTPSSPIAAGGILGAGFGITHDKVADTIWVGNFGWGDNLPSASNGSVSNIALDGSPLSPSNAYFGGTDRVQGIIADQEGNIWMSSYDNNKTIVFLGGDPNDTLEINTTAPHPFGLALSSDNTVWSAMVGKDSNTSGVSHYRINNNQIELLSFTRVGNELKGLDVDFDGSVWVASGGDDAVYHLDSNGTVDANISGIGGLSSPWSVRIDDAGDVWVANFGPMHGGAIYINTAITVLAGVQSTSSEPLGTALSPSSGFTLPSAGEEVVLSDGTPLSSTGPTQPKYVPMMRPVSVVPDRAGNLWVSNNWKPSFDDDLALDPGGDGMVIFIGLGAPTEPGRTQ